MTTTLDLYRNVRKNFVAASAHADIIHVRMWDEVGEETTYVWFESLAQAINEDMVASVPFESHADLFEFIATAALNGKAELVDCIDVSFVENLFWDVPKGKAKRYWTLLPAPLKELYVAFHRKEPI